MSLDVYLIGEEMQVPCECIRCGNAHTYTTRKTFYNANITHNLNKMAEEAGIYEALWRPYKLKPCSDFPEDDYAAEMEFERVNIVYAREIIEPLTKGVELLKSDPQRFEKFNSSNGWGTYKDFIPFVEQYLAACIEHPDAQIDVSR